MDLEENLSPRKQSSALPSTEEVKKGSDNDHSLATRSDLRNISSNVVECESRCPSCQMNTEHSKLANIFAFMQRQNLPLTQENFYQHYAHFGGSDAHSIVAQSVLRSATRNLLSKYMDRFESRSPCLFEDTQTWDTYLPGYIDGILDACSKPLEGESTRKTIESKLEQGLNRKTPDANLEKLEHLEKGGWEKEEESKETERAAQKFNPESFPHYAELSPGEQDNFENFWRRTPKGPPERPTSFEISPKTEQPAAFFARARNEIPGTEVRFEKIVDDKGMTYKYTEEVFISDVGQGPLSLMKSQAPLWKDAWVGSIFSNIMGKPFTLGTQCRYCEELQGNGSIIERYHYFKAHERDTPPEFVGKHLLAELGSFESPEQYVREWMKNVAAKLRERILTECEDLRRKEQKEQQTTGKDEQKDNTVRELISEEDVDEALRAKLGDMKNKYLNGFPLSACVGQVTAWLKLNRSSKALPGDLEEVVKNRLAVDNSLEWVDKIKKYKPK